MALPNSKLVRQNQVHHNKVPNAIGRTELMRKLIKRRNKYFSQRLKKYSLFRRLLSKEIPFKVSIRGKLVDHKLLRLGANKIKIRFRGNARPIELNLVFVLDELLRVRAFCNCTVNGEFRWYEARPLAASEKDPTCLNAGLKDLTHSGTEIEKQISKVIIKSESQINFSDEISAKDVVRIMKLM